MPDNFDPGSSAYQSACNSQIAAKFYRPEKTMPRYRSHKEVSALKIAHVYQIGDDGTTEENPIVSVDFVDELFAPIELSLRGRPTPAAGWYYVVYPDSYESFSPPLAFEAGYDKL